MVLYSFFLFLSLKDSAYLYYILLYRLRRPWLFFRPGHAKLVVWPVLFSIKHALVMGAGMMMTWGAVFTTSS